MITYYDILLTLLKPLIFIMGKIGLPHRKITGKHYFKYRDSIEIGTVLLTRTDWELSNLTNPCELKHAAIYVGNIFGDEIKYVFEETGEGAILTDLVTFMLGKDIVVGCSFKHRKEILQAELQKTVLRFKGTPYDYLFDRGVKSMYCFELAAMCLQDIFPSLKLKVREILKGKQIFDHNTFLDSEFFEIVFDSRKDAM